AKDHRARGAQRRALHHADAQRMVAHARLFGGRRRAHRGNHGAQGRDRSDDAPHVLRRFLRERELRGELSLDAVARLHPRDETAHHVVESMHLLTSPTIFFAAYTGVLLWASSIVAGWLENWAVYHRLPDALAHHRQLGFVFGRERMQRFSKAFAGALSGIGGNVALGVFLGMTVPIAGFFGLPLDVRHVTLSTGSLALAGAALGWRACLHAGFIF